MDTAKEQTNNNVPRSQIRGVLGMGFTELWERFSFYGLQSILVFYLLYELDQGGLALGAAASAGIVGAYGGAVYLSQLLGAWLGERVVSPSRLVLFGGIVIAFGHIALSLIPGVLGLSTGLLLIIFGTGALKTNITSIVGFILEDESDARRDAGFSYFYMGINFGAVFGPLSTGFAQNEWGFHPGFALAAIGMIVAVVQFIFSSRGLPERAKQVTRPISAPQLRRALIIAGAGLVVVVIAVATGLLTAARLSTIVTILTLLAATAYFIVIINSKKITRHERRRVKAFIPMFVASGLYFGFLFQKYTAISILIDERVNRDIGSWQFPVGWVTMIGPLAGFLAAPLIASMWMKLGSRQPKAAAKFGIGLIQIGVAFAFMLIVSGVLFHEMIPVSMILVYMVIAGSSEFFVGPIGLALATQIAPKAFTAQMVAINFLTLALGSSLSGLLGQFSTVATPEAYFALLGVGSVVCGVALIVSRKHINRGLYAGLE